MGSLNDKLENVSSTKQIVDSVAPFNVIEISSIVIIILLIVSLFVYHCRRRTSNSDKNLQNGVDKDFKRKRLRRHHSFSRSSLSFISNLESVREEPEFEIVTDTTMTTGGDVEGQEDALQQPWYKWVTNDSSPQMNICHQSENDLRAMNDIEHEDDDRNDINFEQEEDQRQRQRSISL